MSLSISSTSNNISIDATTNTITFSAPGPQGTPGATGAGVPTGGATATALFKNSATNYDTSFRAIAQSDVTNLTADLAAKAALAASDRRSVADPPNASVGTWAPATNAAAYNRGWIGTTGAAQNDYGEWELGPLLPGTYSLTLLHYKSTTLGIYTIDVAGTTVGTVDGYAASGAAASAVITGITVPALATVPVRFTMATKNASSSSYMAAISGFSLTRTGA
jgi:hypothetical protein